MRNLILEHRQTHEFRLQINKFYFNPTTSSAQECSHYQLTTEVWFRQMCLAACQLLLGWSGENLESSHPKQRFISVFSSAQEMVWAYF